MKMLITINVPDNTAKITYATLDESGVYIGDDRPVTADMLVKVERE